MAKVSKIVHGGRTLIDLTQDTVTKDTMLVGTTAHGADGEPIEGACTFDVDSSEANAAQAEVLQDRIYAKGGKLYPGTMPNNGAVAGKISSKDEEYSVPQGYHDGGGKVGIADVEKAKLIAENIRKGVTILNVEGNMTGTEDANPQAREVIPSTDEQVILPETGYNYLSQVTVKPIPYKESTNSAGGITVTIG